MEERTKVVNSAIQVFALLVVSGLMAATTIGPSLQGDPVMAFAAVGFLGATFLACSAIQLMFAALQLHPEMPFRTVIKRYNILMQVGVTVCFVALVAVVYGMCYRLYEDGHSILSLGIMVDFGLVSCLVAFKLDQTIQI